MQIILGKVRSLTSPGRGPSTGSDHYSPDRNKHLNVADRTDVSQHKQPRDAQKAVDTIRDLPRRSGAHGEGYDGVGVLVVDAPNDFTIWTQVTAPPAPNPAGDVHYATMLQRMAHEYDARFSGI